jgi:predicted RNase H-like HicB family nuclease
LSDSATGLVTARVSEAMTRKYNWFGFSLSIAFLGFALEIHNMRQVIIYPDLEDGGWVAEVASLPGCPTQGASKEEVLTRIKDAIDAWIEGATASGLTIPAEHFNVQVCVI